MKTIINNFTTGNRTFTIVFDQDFYMAIEDKYLDENGCLKKKLCGPQLYAMRTLDDCLKHVSACVEQDALVAQGYSLAEAFCKVQNIECTDEIRKLFNELAA